MNVLGRDIKALQRVFGALGHERRGPFGFSPEGEGLVMIKTNPITVPVLLTYIRESWKLRRDWRTSKG